MSVKAISRYLCNHIGGVIVSVLKSSAQDCRSVISGVKSNTIKLIFAVSLLDMHQSKTKMSKIFFYQCVT
jgi:hypothetical protein